MITEFIKPKTIAEALHEKQANPEAIYMAGGAWINSSLSKMKPETIVSLNELKIDKIHTDTDYLAIGAMATLQQIIDCDLTPTVVKQCLLELKNRNIRNQGTIGGAIATKNPAFPINALLIAMGAELDLSTNIPTTVEQYTDGLILSVRIPLKTKAAYAVYSQTARGVALITAAVGKKSVLAQADGKIEILPVSADMTAEQIEQKITAVSDYRAGEKFKKYLASQMFVDCFKAAGEQA